MPRSDGKRLCEKCRERKPWATAYTLSTCAIGSVRCDDCRERFARWRAERAAERANKPPRRRPLWSQAEIAALVAASHAGKTLGEAARATGRSKESTRAKHRALQLPPLRRPDGEYPWLRREDELWRLRVKGWSRPRIARKYGVSPNAVSGALYRLRRRRRKEVCASTGKTPAASSARPSSPAKACPPDASPS